MKTQFPELSFSQYLLHFIFIQFSKCTQLRWRDARKTVSCFARFRFHEAPRFEDFLSEALQVSLLVGLGGLEPPTSRLSGVRSNRLSYKPIVPDSVLIPSPCGGDKRDRTVDLLLAKQALSQLSYTPMLAAFSGTRFFPFCHREDSVVPRAARLTLRQ